MIHRLGLLFSLITVLGHLTSAYPHHQYHPESMYETYGDHSFAAASGERVLIFDDGFNEEEIFTGDSNFRSGIKDEDRVLDSALKNPLKLVSDEEELVLDAEELNKDNTPTIKDLESAMQDEEDDDDDEDDDEDEDEESDDRQKRYLFDGSSGINDSYGWYGWPGGSQGGKHHHNHASHNHHHGHLPTYHHGFYTAYYK